MKKIFVIIMLFISIMEMNAQSKDSWPHIPGFDPALHTTLNNRNTLVGVLGLAALSYGLEEFVFKNHKNVNLYTVRAGMNNEYAYGYRNVFHQNIGIEHKVASWFSASAEFNLQEWSDSSPNLDTKDKFGLGMSVMTYYRWTVFGKKRISPFIEYGTGLFYGFKDFPSNGNNFTFNNSTLLGIKYRVNQNDEVRAGYGHFNQTNYNLLNSNPAYNGYGFSIIFSRKM